MRRIACVSVVGVLLTGALAACGRVDGPAGSLKEAAASASASASASAEPDESPTTPRPSTSTRPPTSPRPTTSRPVNTTSPRPPLTAADVPKLSVPDLLSLARTAARGARTVHVRATVLLGGTTKTYIDVNVDRERENFHGTLTNDSYSVYLVRIDGSVWIKGDERYWIVSGKGQVTPEQARLYATKYLRTTADDPAAKMMITGVLQASNPEYVVDQLDDRSTKLPTQPFENWQLIPIRAADGTTGYFNAGLPVYPVRLISGGPEPEADNYDRFNEPVNIAEPPPAQVVDVPGRT